MLKSESTELERQLDAHLTKRTVHIVTCEYPPQYGGVSDYTESVAKGLAAEGDEIHVWCPGNSGSEADLGHAGVTAHREFGVFSPSDLRRVGERLDRFTKPRNILVQWVPHGYGYRSMNFGFCWWLAGRARDGDTVHLMVHEPYLPFSIRSWRQNAAALVHRLMTIVLLRKARQVWMSIPYWEGRLKPYAMGRDIPFEWLPVTSNVVQVNDEVAERNVRSQYAPGGAFLIGHFGTFGSTITSLLEPLLIQLGGERENQSVLLMGLQSKEFREAMVAKHPKLAGMIRATGALSAEQLSSHIAACDLLIQPYPDGVSTRRGSFLAGLSHGKPIVTTTGELTEPFWQDAQAVALAPAGDANRFIKLIQELRGDGELRNRLADAGKRLYDNRFDIRHVISRLRSADWDAA
jgi:glycosyltransferase involved in cell wall biosynthesis